MLIVWPARTILLAEASAQQSGGPTDATRAPSLVRNGESRPAHAKCPYRVREMAALERLSCLACTPIKLQNKTLRQIESLSCVNQLLTCLLVARLLLLDDATQGLGTGDSKLRVHPLCRSALRTPVPRGHPGRQYTRLRDLTAATANDTAANTAAHGCFWHFGQIGTLRAGMTNQVSTAHACRPSRQIDVA